MASFNAAEFEKLRTEEVAQVLCNVELMLTNDQGFHKRFVSCKPNPQFPSTFASKLRRMIKDACIEAGLPGYVTGGTIMSAYARELVRRRLQELWNMPRPLDDSSCSAIPNLEYWKDEPVANAFFSPAFSDELINPATPDPKEDTMSIIKIETKTFVNGTDITSWSDGDIYNLIAQQEKDIEKLEDIQNKPKRLENEIAERKAGIQALVDHLNARDAK